MLTTSSAVLTAVLFTMASALTEGAAVQQMAAFAGFVLLLATLGFARAWLHALKQGGAKS